MNTLVDLRTHRYLARVSVFLFTVALAAGMLSCPSAPLEYALSVLGTEGGTVTAPGQGTFVYPGGAVVVLAASPDEGYSFVAWTGDVDTIDDVNSATTTITMNSHCLVTANFAQEAVPEPPTPEPPPLETQVVKIAVAGPMSLPFPYGVDMMRGAQLAIDEIGAFEVGGRTFAFELIEVDTADITGDIVATRMAVEDKVGEADFFIGGFRTERAAVMMEVVCEENGKILLGLGAGGVSLTEKVLTDFEDNKYFFRVAPVNDYFLGASAARIVHSVIVTLLQDPHLPFAGPADINVYILAEDQEWANVPRAIAETELLPALGVNHVGTARPAPAASAEDLVPTIADMVAKNTHVVMTLLSGPVGFSWAQARHGAALPVVSAGINQFSSMTAFSQFGPAALYEISLDITVADIALSPITQHFLTAFMARHDVCPVWPGASAYDAIRLLKAAIETTGGSLDSDAIAAAIAAVDLHAVGGRLAFYPMPAIDLGEDIRALSAAQAYALYGDHLLAFYDQPSFAALEAHWMSYVGDWTSPPHLPQDMAYGPAVGNTAMASQWQGTAADPVRVGVWPRQLMPAATPVEALKAMGLFDKWGNWNLQYLGTEDILIPPLFYEKWGG